jgi:hypothetical protein
VQDLGYFHVEIETPKKGRDLSAESAPQSMKQLLSQTFSRGDRWHLAGYVGNQVTWREEFSGDFIRYGDSEGLFHSHKDFYTIQTHSDFLSPMFPSCLTFAVQARGANATDSFSSSPDAHRRL